MLEHFPEIINGKKPLTIFTKSFTIGAWRGRKYNSTCFLIENTFLISWLNIGAIYLYSFQFYHQGLFYILMLHVHLKQFCLHEIVPEQNFKQQVLNFLNGIVAKIKGIDLGL